MYTGKPRGFAAMSVEARTAIARMGGAAIPKEKRSFSVDRELASEAGKIGGKIAGLSKKAQRRKMRES